MRSLIKFLLMLPLALGLGLTGAQAQTVSNCSRSLGEQYLDVNNVRARILNTGGLFYRGEPHVYEVPKGSGSNAIFASGIWLAGQVDGQLRATATRYGEWELWAGPLDDNGNPPVDCTQFDRVYKVSTTDVERYETGGGAAPDLRDWPTGLGAPTLAPPDNGVDDDNDGEVDERGELLTFDITTPLASRQDRVIDLAAGERPGILGDQTIWWVMNDRGNVHESTDAPPIGVEVHGTAFAFNTAGDIGNTTFYKFNVFYKGSVTLENAYMGIFSDPDLGDFADDYVGSDSTLGLGYVYNADNEDVGGEGYGTPPPAAGYDFFQGPIVPSPGDTAQVSGRKIPDFKNLDMTTFIYYNNSGNVNGDPVTGEDYYNYMRGRWKDGSRIKFGGDGLANGATDQETNFMYPGDPDTGIGWTEFNPDPVGGTLAPLSPGDRRFVMSTGPFSINPGDQQEIVFGVVWAKGADNKNSVTVLKQADALAQAAFDVNFELPSPPAAPQVSVTELNGQAVLEWNNSPRSNNYLESYSEADPFAPDENKNYDFEGYIVWQFDDVADQVGRVVAVYDVPNGVGRILDGPPGDEITEVIRGTDAGVQTFHSIGSLTNFRTYYYGVQAYAYNEPSFPKVYASPITRVEVVPSASEEDLSPTAVAAATNTAEPDILATKAGAGEGRVWVDVVNPGRITGESYTVEFYEIEVADKAAFEVSELEENPEELEIDERLDVATAGKNQLATATTYDIKRGGTVLFDGSATGEPAPQRENVVVVDGLQFSVVGPEAGIKGMAVTENAAGPLDPWDMGTFGFNSNGFPWLEEAELIPAGSHPDADRPTRGVQQSTNNSAWGIAVGGGDGTFQGGGSSYIERSITTRPGGRTVAGSLGADNFEIRFSQRCVDNPDSCIGWRRFEDDLPMNVPFEIWNTGTSEGPEDDYRMLPAVLDNGGEVWTASTLGDTVYTDIDLFDVGGDHPVSGGDNDPYTDWVYWFNPIDTSPGEAGYEAFAAAPGNGSADLGDEVLARQVYVNWNGWSDADGDGFYDTIDAALPETGTVFRIITFKPSAPGDVFTVSTAGLGTVARTPADAEAALDNIGIVPNPYKGASAYERSQLIDQVRFTNMPEVATVRIFTLNGTLIKTINKNSPERFISWDLTTDNALSIASGVYLVHVDVPNVGSKVIKFAAVLKKRILNVF